MAILIKKALSINQKWYLTLVIGILINTGWNYKMKLLLDDYGVRVSTLEVENIALKRANIELLSEKFSHNAMVDDSPFATWKKKLVRGLYPMKYMNKIGITQFLSGTGKTMYFYFDRTDDALFPPNEARKFFIQDSLVANYHKDTVWFFPNNKGFTDAIGENRIKDGFWKWRIIENKKDTFLWGQMDKPFIKLKPKRNDKAILKKKEEDDTATNIF